MADYYYTDSEDQSLTGQLKKYVDLQKEKTLLGLVDKSSNVLAEMAVKLVFLVLAFLAFTMLCFGFAFFLNSRLQSPFAGFFITGAVLVLTGVVLFLSGKEWLAELFGNDLIHSIYKDK